MLKSKRVSSALFVIVICLQSFIVAQNAAASSTDTSILKSQNDDRLYRAIKLDNELEVLLVSDPTTDKAAAAMDVNVGSAYDPDDMAGLAHFLEHMLFLGTKKYPDADEYQSFIDEHSGSHNAFTTLEHTNFFFDIDANYLEGALDRFSQQFTAPLFNEKYVEREKNAVHSEFTSGLKDDGRRYYSALKQTLSPNHPYSKFSVGNLSTLSGTNDKTLRKALLDFYRKHYSANVMRLVIIGRDSLDLLETWAREKFSQVPNTRIDKPEINQAFFDKNALPMEIDIEPIRDTRSMTVAFPIPSSFPYRDAKPVQYLANLIGHEGKGSLLSSLKENQLVNSLAAGDNFDTHYQSIFTISMDLTENGLQKKQEILKQIFAYIDLIKTKGIKKLYFDENRKILKTAFNFKEKQPPIHSASRLANLLQDYSPQNVLLAGYDLKAFEPKIIRQFLDRMKPDNMVVAVSAKKLETNQKTTWYKTPYKISKINQKTIQSVSAQHSEYLQLSLPEENSFIPDDILLKKLPAPENPIVLNDTEKSRLWYAADISFGTPKANLYINLRSPIANNSPLNADLIDLLTSMLNDNLGEFSYPASLAGLQYELYNHIRGISIKLGGYSDKQSVLLRKILSVFKNSELNPQRFEIHKERLIRALKNAKQAKPYNQTITKARELLVNPSWSEDERLQQAEDITLKDLKAYRNQYFTHLEVVILANGNITPAGALNMQATIESLLLDKDHPTRVPRADVRKLDNTSLLLENLSLDHPDSAMTYYLQGKDKSFSERARYMLLGQVLATPYYSQIRTNKQLGYIVFATDFEMFEVPGIAFIVQSPKASAFSLTEETFNFLQENQDIFKNMTDDKFEQFKRSLLVKLMDKDKTLGQRSNRYWQEIDKSNFRFNSKEQLAKAISSLSRIGFQDFYEELMARSKKGLLVYSEGKSTKPTDAPLTGDKASELLKSNHYF